MGWVLAFLCVPRDSSWLVGGTALIGSCFKIEGVVVEAVVWLSQKTRCAELMRLPNMGARNLINSMISAKNFLT